MQPGIYVEQIKPGDWRVCQSAQLVPPSGQISATSYPSQEEALKAAREGKYE
jgi:hypothetical protein